MTHSAGPRQEPGKFITLDFARRRLAQLWFPAGGLLLLILIGQSLGGAYGTELETVWGWALPNFLPTLALMVSVFAANALLPYDAEVVMVRNDFFALAWWLSVFYLFVLLLSVLVQPFMQFLGFAGAVGVEERIQVLQISNFWLGPIQGVVALALGILFFLKDRDRSGGDEVKGETGASKAGNDTAPAPAPMVRPGTS
jgi:hypothetical protein